MSLEPTKKPDVKKHLSATTANLVHGCDGAHLCISLTELDFPWCTTHDAVSGRPCKEMDVIAKELRKGLVKVAESDVLRRFVELNGLDWHDFPAPHFGDYDPAEVLEADYCFC